MAREGHIHPIIKIKGKEGGKGFGLKILWCFSPAAHRLSCLQEEKDVLWCHSHQKNESSVSAASWGGSHCSQVFGGSLRAASNAVLLSGWQRYTVGSWCKGREHLENPQPNLVLTDIRAGLPWFHCWVKVWQCGQLFGACEQSPSARMYLEQYPAPKHRQIWEGSVSFFLPHKQKASD